jgi:two-component system LytT family response regulator
MPKRSGFEMLQEIDNIPLVIFTTAHNEFAIRAFDVNALDYLVKPIVKQRLDLALDRAFAEYADLPSLPEGGVKHLTRLFIKDRDRCWLIAASDIVLMMSEGNYTRVITAAGKPLLPRSLNYLDSRLDPTQFFRISRKHIVNVSAITSVRNTWSGGLRLTLANDQEVDMSRRQTQRFRQLLEI